MEEDDEQAFKNYLEKERQLGHRTIAIYLFYHKHFEPLKLSQEYIHDFIIEHKNNFTVRGFIKNYLEFHGIEKMFELPKRTKGSKPKRIIRDISDTQMELLRAWFSSKSFKQGLMFELMYQGALRRVEVITITLGSFLFEDWLTDTTKFCKVIIFGKGKRERYILINPETAESIINHFMKANHLEDMNDIIDFFSRREDELLFTKDLNKHPLTEKMVYDIIKKGSLKAIKRDVRPHELRHRRATELEKRNVNIRDIKNYLGHSKIATTEIYLHKSGTESLSSIEKNLSSPIT